MLLASRSAIRPAWRYLKKGSQKLRFPNATRVESNRSSSSSSSFHGARLFAANLPRGNSVLKHRPALRFLCSSVATQPSAVEEMSKDAPAITYRKDYKPTPYLFDTVDLSFNLNEDVTTVTAKLHAVPNHQASGGEPPAMKLDGRSDMKLIGLKINGEEWSDDKFTVTPKDLTIEGLPQADFEMEIVTEIKPQENTLLEGLYKSSGNYCTQCEAAGYRGITYFYDRPDVMSMYRVRVEADKEKYPVLLSNGNLEEKGDLEGGRHFALWVDPHKKPCYLFALVAGDLAKHEGTFTTMSGKTVQLRVYAQAHNINKVPFAMESLKQAMKWDEDRFGREYDLEIFNIVAVDDFNMGAMENKSLNIFNSICVLALPETASDAQFMRIQGIVAHEYFHNWTGDRVTCRDWFQLTLKEGLTVFRDQEFSSDLNSRTVNLIDNVRVVRTSQFSEDAGAMAHPIRPESYIKMDNFYTATVYRKGAQVVRMYQTLLGKDGFRKGMDLYFKRHDGQAVACEEFMQAMSDANKKDLSSLFKWYGQAGTPQLSVSCNYDESAKTFSLTVKQMTPPTPGQDEKVAVLIPISVGLLGPDGKDLPLKLKGSSDDPKTTAVLEFDKEEDTFVFEDVSVKPVPSILRSFSAPVRLTVEGQTEEDLLFLFANDSDEFNRWEAGQKLAKNIIIKMYDAAMSKDGNVEEGCNSVGGVPQKVVDAFRAIFEDKSLDGQYVALASSLPAHSELIREIDEADPVVLHDVKSFVTKKIASELRDVLEDVLSKNDSEPGEAYVVDLENVGKRSLKNHCLTLLASLNEDKYNKDCLRRFREANNMTDEKAALTAINSIDCPERKTALQEFYEKWKDDNLVVLQWLGLQSTSNIPGNTKAMHELLSHPAYNVTNPNCNYFFIRTFSTSPVNFHAADGSGYAFMREAILKLDKVNPQVAARVLHAAFMSWKDVDKVRQGLIKDQLRMMAETGELSENTAEIVSKNLDD